MYDQKLIDNALTAIDLLSEAGWSFSWGARRPKAARIFEWWEATDEAIIEWWGPNGLHGEASTEAPARWPTMSRENARWEDASSAIDFLLGVGLPEEFDGLLAA